MAFHLFGGCLVHHGIRGVGLRLVVIALSAVHVAFQLGHIAQVVQRERIIGVNQISLVEESLGFINVMAFQGLHTIAIERLHRGVLALLRLRNTQLVLVCAKGLADSDGETE